MKKPIITIWLGALTSALILVSSVTVSLPSQPAASADSPPAAAISGQGEALNQSQDQPQPVEQSVVAIINPEQPIATSREISELPPAESLPHAPAAKLDQTPADPTPIATVTIEGLGNFPVAAKEGDYAIDVIRRASSQYAFTINTISYTGLGEMIVQLGDRYGGPPDWSHWWEFIFNGQSSMVGASIQPVKAGDTIGWIYH